MFKNKPHFKAESFNNSGYNNSHNHLTAEQVVTPQATDKVHAPQQVREEKGEEEEGVECIGSMEMMWSKR